MAAVADKVRIKLTQGIVGHRTSAVPAHNKTVKQTLESGKTADVLVKVPDSVELIGEFAYAKDDVVDWPNAAEAERFIEKGYAVRVDPKNN